MKTVIVGGSKILIGFLVVILVLGATVLWWFMFGIRPYDRINGKIKGVMRSDPDKALAMFPQLFAQLDKDKMSPEDYGNAYSEYGFFLKDHLRFKEAREAFNTAAVKSEKGYLGITKTNAIVAAAECQLDQNEQYKPTSDDLKTLLAAGATHSSRETSSDKWFWPAYDTVLGNMYARMGEVDKAISSLETSVAEYDALKAPWPAIQSRALIVDALVRAGRYAEANKKFVEFMKDDQHNDYKYALRASFKGSLARAQDKEPDFQRKLITMLEAKQFAELDKLAEERLASGKIWPSGRWYENDFYRAFDGISAKAFEKYWQKRISLMEEWVKARPQSSTAKIALAEVLASYAWKARGSGYSDTVSEEGWKLFGDRLNQAMALLDRVKDKPAAWYDPAQQCALGQGWPRARYDAMVGECRKRYPDFASVVFHKCYYLLPRWHGNEGEMESYLAGEANKKGGVAGDILYGQGAWYLDNTITDVMNESSLSWPRVKAGLQANIKAHPESLVARGVLSILAMEAKDENTALSAFEDKAK